MREAGGKHQWPIPDYISGRATFSEDGEYRYVLWREWGDIETDGYAVFVGLNPSTAAANMDDPTVRRCWGMAREWGFGGMAMLNLYAYRATSPDDMRDAAGAGIDPVGPDNDHYLRAICADADVVIAAWGVVEAPRAQEVADLLLDCGKRKLYVLTLTKNGHPHHPLYLKSGLRPMLWREILLHDGSVATGAYFLA